MSVDPETFAIATALTAAHLKADAGEAELGYELLLEAREAALKIVAADHREQLKARWREEIHRYCQAYGLGDCI
jgi:hypothetical protein